MALDRLRPFAAASCFAMIGCAALKPTPQQDFARAAWDSCYKTANLSLDRIDADGRIHYRAMNAPVGMRDLEECIQQYYATHPQPAR